MDVTLETNEARIPRRSHYKLARRFVTGFSRVSGAVRKLHISLKVDERKQGDDKICQIQIFLASGGQIVIKQRAKRFAMAMAAGIRRARQLLVQHAAKRRRKRRDLSLLPVPA